MEHNLKKNFFKSDNAIGEEEDDMSSHSFSSSESTPAKNLDKSKQSGENITETEPEVDPET